MNATAQPFHRYYLLLTGTAYVVYALFTLLLHTRLNVLSNIQPLINAVGLETLGVFWVVVGALAMVVGVTGQPRAVALGFAAIAIPPFLWAVTFLVTQSWGPMVIWLLMGIQVLITAQMIDPPRSRRLQL